MSETKLKPCPFCGSDDLRLVTEQGEYVAYIECRYCEARGPEYLIEVDRLGFPEVEEQYKYCVFEEWNSRYFNEKIIEAMDKAVPMPFKEIVKCWGTCPTCERRVLVGFPNVPENFQYCSNCGQRFGVPKEVTDRAEKDMQDFVKEVRKAEKEFDKGVYEY